MSIIDLGNFASLLDRRYQEITQQQLASMVDIIPMIYDVQTSTESEERRSAVGEMPEWTEFEGQLTYAREHEQYNVVATHRTFTQGRRITQQMLEDDLSGIMRGDKFAPMVRSAVVTRNQLAARLFNFMGSNDTYFYVNSEGVPLVSASHTTRTPGVSTATGFSNVLTVALSPTSYRAARIQFRKLRNDQGQLIGMEADELWVPVDLQPRAEEILQSRQVPDSNNNAISPEFQTATVKALLHWTSTQNWFLANRAGRLANCIWFDRVKPDYRTVADFDTYQIKSSGRMRASIMRKDWRWGVGALVA